MSISKRHVLVDVDGVLADFVGATTDALYIDLDGPFMEVEELTNWDLLSHMEEQYRAPMIERWKSKGFCADIEVYPGAIEGIRQLREIADVHFLTAPLPESKHWLQERTEWLYDHFRATHKDITFTHTKHRVIGDVLIDDKVEHIEEWGAKHGSGIPILFARPYNTGGAIIRHSVLQPLQGFRTGSWDDIVSVVRQMS